MKTGLGWFFRTRTRRALVGLVILLVVLRIVAPFVILTQLNDKLAQFSPIYRIHIDDLSLGILRGAYRIEGLTGDLKKNNQNFLKIDMIDVSVAWRELIRGHILTDVVIDGPEFILMKDLTETAAGDPKESKKAGEKAGSTLFPVRVERLDVHNGSFEYSELKWLPPGQRLRVTSIDGRVSNLTPSEALPFALMNFHGTILDSAAIKVIGRADTLRKPLAWETDIELREFDLVKANPMLLRLLPFSFTAGKLDLYSELRSENGRLEGYAKPFLKKVRVLPRNGEYKGIKHFFFEIGGALGNVLLRNSDEKSLAAKIPFIYENGEFKLEKATTLATLFEHGFEGGIPAGIEDNLNLKEPAKGTRDYSKDPPEIKVEDLKKSTQGGS